ncbi:MAG TPA: carboxypeptidase-like regulatory domain-containing protein [Vicinamibacterales bacterium]|nr:carboxypeptidase-like regulatory domain-containing protein [Vicinamibacterales bacterium]
MNWRSVVATWVIVLCATSAHAQFDSAQISGVVQDTTGAVLPGVDIVLVNVGTRIERQAVTNEAGLYTFPNVPVGEYRITAMLSGFKPITKSNVQVNAGLNIRVDVSLEVGALSETISVEAATTLVDTSVIGRTLRAEQIAETPLSGRRASQVAQLAPGVVGGNMGGSVPTGTGTFATGVTSINGGRSDEFITTIDGAPSIRVRAAGGFMMGAQNFDTVAEVQVLTTNYQAEYGRSSAGQLRLVTKSGTQSFRGNVFWSHQNDALDANTWTRKRAGLEKSPHKYNAYGFTLGGPLYIPGAFNTDRQKLFFFWGQEWQRDRTVEDNNTQTGNVPTAAMKNGDFSALLPGRVIRDPLTGLPFPGNMIPQNRISPQGRALLNAFPLPTPGFQQGANNYLGNPSVFNNQRKDSIKIDWVPTSNHRVAVRHTWAPNVWNDPEPLSVYSTIWDYPGRTLAATLTSTLSSSLINEFSFSWGSTSPSKYFGQRNCDYCPGGTTAFMYPTQSEVGINYPYLFPGTKLDPEKIPNISLQGFNPAINNAAYPGSWNDFVFLWSDNVTKITGNHTFKAGVMIERSGMNDRIQLSFATAPATTNQNGSFRFMDGRAGGTGYSVANALLGLFDDYTEFGNKPNTKWLAMGYDVYAQDSWKPARDLTLELGLRYSLWQPWGTTNLAMASFQSQFYDPSTAPVIDRAGGFVVSGDRFNGVVLPGDEPTDEALVDFPQLANLQRLYHGVPNGFSETPTDGFQPRLGLAYAINDVTTFRAGVGRFLNRVQINTTAAYGFNAPLSEMQTVINGIVDAPGGASTRNFPLVGAMQSPDFTNPVSWAWNATVDRELPWAMRGTVSYVGRSASRLERARNINQLQPGTIQANPGANANALRPYLGFSTVTSYETTGTSRYNSLQTQVERRSTRGVGFSVAYTFARTTDNGAGRNDLLPNAFDDSGYYGISDLDRPHVLVSQVRYALPRLESSAAPVRWVLGNWDVSGILQAQSGMPFSVRTPVDIAGVGPGSGQQFYNLVGDPKAARTEWDPELSRATWFDRNAFQVPATGTFATTQKKNTLRQPGFWDINLSLRKAFNVPGTNHRFDLRVEAFNFMNRTRLDNAVTNPTLPDFGYITSLTGNRTMQIGMQYVF